jgi:Fur family zinc uptake transcriptional regulator
MQDAPDSRAFALHDHAHCAGDMMARAEALSRDKGLRLTPVRRRTLEILLEAHRALGAYDVLYRALEFLVEQGLAHRIRRLNAFTACMHPGESHAPAFLICRLCDAVAEAPAAPVRAALDQAASDLGFAIERSNIEALGLCPTCRPEAAA